MQTPCLSVGFAKFCNTDDAKLHIFRVVLTLPTPRTLPARALVP